MTDPQIEDFKKKLQDDPDFISNRRYDYSLNKLMARFPDGVPASVAARSLMMTEEDLKALEGQVISKLRRQLKVK